MPPSRQHGRRRGNNPQRRESHQPERLLTDVWPQYLQEGYFDGDGNLQPQYVTRERMNTLAKAMNDARPGLTMHQLRRFFQHCRAIEAKLRAKTSTWAAEEVAFRQIDVASADAFGKQQKKIPQIFHDFIKCNVAAVKNEKDFLKGFLPHFEALVGFGSQYFKERERN